MPLKKKRPLNWRLYAITCPERLRGRDLAALAEEAIRGGADVLQLRDKEASDEEFLAKARMLGALTRRLGVPLIINDRLWLVKECGADGVHLGQEDGSIAQARQMLGDDAIIGRSTHSAEQALAAEREGFDYVGVGPVYATPTKPGRAPVGLDLVRFASEHLKIPFVAIGGIDQKNAGQVRGAGAKCVAVVRALMGSGDPKASAETLLREMKNDHAK
jgi:thiamine-phosphate pyrophosphorylase